MPITVIAIRTEDAFDQADALTKALRVGLKAIPGWRLGDGDYSLEVLTLLLKCSDLPDADCQARIADQIRSDRYLWGVLRKVDSIVVADLHLWTRGQPLKSTTVEYSANLTEPNDEALRGIAVDALDKLTGGPPKGSVRVRTGVPRAEVFIDGRPAGAVQNGEATFTVMAGPHKVLVRSQGFLDAESAVMVPPIATTDVALSQIPVQQPSPRQMNWRRVGGFAGVGAGAVFGTAAVISTIQAASVRGDARFATYRSLFYNGVENVCDDEQMEAARRRFGAGDSRVTEGIRLCERSDTFTTLQFVFYPLAALSAGVGVYLLMTSDDERPAERTGWTVQPDIGLDGSKLNVSYRF